MKAKRKVRSTKKGPTVKMPIRLQQPVYFEPYTGKRWQIPPGMKVNKAVQDKFRLFETFSKDIIIQKLRGYNKLLLTHICYLPFNIDGVQKWTPPQVVVTYLKLEMNRSMYEWKAVSNIYNRLFKMKRILNGLVHRWRINKCIKNCKNTEDLVTSEYPKKLVRIMDFPRRISYIFEAPTIRKIIELRITTSEYMFPNPLSPINPFTNEEFTQGQILSIISQCKKHGENNWIFDRLYASEANLRLFYLRFRQPIKILAIENHFKGENSKYRDEVIDFFEIQVDRYNLDNDYSDKFIYRMDNRPNCSFIKEWVVLTRDFYIASELNDIELINNINTRIVKLIGKSYSLLNH